MSKKDERRAYIITQMDIAADFSDGAFWGFMQESGIEADEIVEVSKWLAEQKKATDSA